MTLSDVMGAAGLTLWAEIALVLFFAAFLALVIFLVATRKSNRWDRVRRLPLEDDDAPAEGDTQGSDARRGARGGQT